MVHAGSDSPSVKVEQEVATSVSQIEEPVEHIEDFLEEVEDCDDVQVEGENGSMEIEVDEPPDPGVPKGKNKYFSCNKCSYVTHIRARYTKHVKYHSMPMIKCTMCEFRTPYKWNLDRHMKNHGGSGNFTCSMCNFTADIKQSLTVHEMNHHTAIVGQQNACRRRNRVGASDLPLDDFVAREEEESGDSRSSHSASDMGAQYADIEMVSCNSESNDAVASEGSKNEDSQMSQEFQSNPQSCSKEEKSQKQRKAPRPIPQLIPLNTPAPTTNKTSVGEPPAKKFKESTIKEDVKKVFKFENLPSDITIIPANNLPKEATARKKNESFFDRLKERLLTETGEEGSLICKNCGFKSKCLSEHSVHEKNCAASANRVATSTPISNLSSTRCQNCRHRCKSSADLFIHLKTCKKIAQGDQSVEIKCLEQSEIKQNNDAIGPHPMENVVFVWNNISHDGGKYNSPLGISINDDSTMPPDLNKIYDSEVIDENESMNLSPSNAIGKKVFKCPHCAFWASTASRFHVHIVGHLNKKPFECSLCKYKSNWRWDITKHIKLKSARDPEHNDAKVLMTDETGRRNYSKYNRFLAVSVTNDNGENEFHYLDPNAQNDGMLEVDDSLNDLNDRSNSAMETLPLDLQTQQSEIRYETMDKQDDVKKPKRTFWKCKKCNYKDSSKEALLEHIKEHANKNVKKPENVPDPADVAYRCGHCNQLSNWKHVIQRHCRLKHDGIINVITTVRPKQDPTTMALNEATLESCMKCPYKTDDKKQLSMHMQQHQPSPLSIFKCYYCDFFVKSEPELMQHLTLHGVTEPEDYLNTIKAMEGKSPVHEPAVITSVIPTKRHKCTDCPYETNSKSQYMYHEQFHRLPADTPYKCPECNYSVSKRHLLHQHLRVHGIIPKKNELDGDFDGTLDKSELKLESCTNLDVTPYVWVSARDEFHKMYKCRYCSYVNTQECKIPNHEKIHCITFESSDITIYKCLECKFTCDNAVRLAEHSKSHGEIYGRIYCPVEEDIPDEEQISKFRKVLEIEKSIPAESTVKEEWSKDIDGVKILFFCQRCPSRFFTDCELKVHDKFHDLSFPNKCQHCEFSVAQENDLKTHSVTHSDEYHTKTKMLKFAHNIHPAHREPKMEFTSDLTWIVSYPGKNYETVEHSKKEGRHVSKHYLCKECPAKFFKSSALNYHMALHGGEGDYKCKKCSYVVKNVGNLAKHELLHENEGKTNCDYESGDDVDYKNIPLSGTDLFQRKTEAQKRVLTDKDKLVKPNDHFPPVLQADPQFGYLMHGNPEFIYPTYLKNGRQKEKRYKCHKCPSAFEKREQYKIHLSLHGSKQRYKCELCDYSVKYYANYVQHMRKHQMNDEAQAERKKCSNGFNESENEESKQEESTDNIKLAIKTMPKGPPKGLVKSDFQQFSISDQQTLRLLQRRRSFIDDMKETNDVSPTKERKMHLCLLCPYTNQRLDALNNHYRRHDDTDVLNAASHKCSYCDLVVVQSHFLREHLKTHFHYMKALTAECYVANADVNFTITKIVEDSDPTTTDLILDSPSKLSTCKDSKIFVKLNTGELQVE